MERRRGRDGGGGGGAAASVDAADDAQEEEAGDIAKLRRLGCLAVPVKYFILLSLSSSVRWWGVGQNYIPLYIIVQE